MPADFAEFLASELQLSAIEVAVLRTVGVRTLEELYSLVRNYPSLGTIGVRVPRLSNYATPRIGARFAAMATSGPALPGRPALSRGAKPPPGAVWNVGSSVPPPSVSPAGGSGAPPPPSASRIDLRLRSWPVRDQGARGTCVAFASTACAEHIVRSALAQVDLSEQFLYWAIKTKTADPLPNEDGTWLEFARDAARSEGICTDTLWRYSGAFDPHNISHATSVEPTKVAIADAASRPFAASLHAVHNRIGGGSRLVLDALAKGRPVAVTLPIFTDPAVSNGADNWTTPTAWSYGRVMNPPPTASVPPNAPGHAVCIVGFEPDPAEPKGGYFVFRNSWGNAWALAVPSPGNSHSPEPGYGDISASYVDDFLWELYQI